MSVDGLRVTSYDGPTPQGGLWNSLPSPFTVAGVKPDLWAVDGNKSLVAVGEAKTAADVCNAHTAVQLAVFGRLAYRGTSRRCPLYIAVPHSAARSLDRVLAFTGLAGAPNIIRIHVPDVLLETRARVRS